MTGRFQKRFAKLEDIRFVLERMNKAKTSHTKALSKAGYGILEHISTNGSLKGTTHVSTLYKHLDGLIRTRPVARFIVIRELIQHMNGLIELEGDTVRFAPGVDKHKKHILGFLKENNIKF
ncbi:MAG: hypothetical protein ACE5DI_06175 [Candidatus Micrarchaeia archaeon]